MRTNAREPWEERGPPWRVVPMDALAVLLIVGAKLLVAGSWSAVAYAVLWIAARPPEES